MNKTLIITGACGMMGSAAVHYFHKYYPDIQLYCVDDLSGGSRDNIPPELPLYQIDLRNVCEVKSFFNTQFKDKSLTYLMHYAAAAHEGRSYFTPIENMSRNDEAFRNVLTCAINARVEHVAFFSSMSRYGSNCTPFTEGMQVKPEDPYAVSKVASELLLRAFYKIYPFTYTIWVPHNCFALNQHIDPYRNVIAIWMNLILQNKTPVIYGTGNQTRAMSWVSDFNATICDALFNPITHGEVINIGGDQQRTINEWYALVQSVTGFAQSAVYTTARPGEVATAFCSHMKARALVGFRSTTPAEEALALMWGYFKQRGPREFSYLGNFDIDSPLIPETWKNKTFEVTHDSH